MKMSKYTISLPLEESKYLLINSHTGAIDLVDEDVINVLQGVMPGDPSVLEILKKNGHLTESSPEEELNDMETMFKKHKEEYYKNHRHVIVVTYDCNLACPYCYLSSIQSQNKHAVIDSDHVEKVFDVIAHVDTLHNSSSRIVLYGGEPLLTKNKPIIKEIMQKGEPFDYPYTILTNGVCVDQFLDVLKKYAVTLQITIDGPQHIHDKRRIKKNGSGTFTHIVNNVTAALKAGLSVILRTNLDKDNTNVLPHLVTFYKEKGWYDHPQVSIQLSPVFQGPGMAYEHFTPRKDIYRSAVSLTEGDPLISQHSFDFKGREIFENVFLNGEIGPPRFFYCDANAGMFIYDPFGDVYVCTEHIGEETAKVGTYYPELLWNEHYAPWRERTIFTIPECRKCKYALFCGGGCGFEAFQHHGTLSKPVCYDFEEVFQTVIPQLYRAARENK